MRKSRATLAFGLRDVKGALYGAHGFKLSFCMLYFNIILHYVRLYYVILYYIILYYIILCYTILYFVHYIVSYYSVVPLGCLGLSRSPADSLQFCGLRRLHHAGRVRQPACSVSKAGDCEPGDGFRVLGLGF